MIDHIDLLPVDRFLHTLNIVSRESRHLAYSRQRLSRHAIDAAWVEQLGQHPEYAEQLEAFVSRFGRMQDTIADKLLPRWLAAIAETPGSMIETLNRAERLGVLKDVEAWLEARKLRNRLVHEYMDDADKFATDIRLALEYANTLFDTYNRIRKYAVHKMKLPESELPEAVIDLT